MNTIPLTTEALTERRTLSVAALQAARKMKKRDLTPGACAMCDRVISDREAEIRGIDLLLEVV